MAATWRAVAWHHIFDVMIKVIYRMPAGMYLAKLGNDAAVMPAPIGCVPVWCFLTAAGNKNISNLDKGKSKPWRTVSMSCWKAFTPLL